MDVDGEEATAEGGETGTALLWRGALVRRVRETLRDPPTLPPQLLEDATAELDDAAMAVAAEARLGPVTEADRHRVDDALAFHVTPVCDA